MTPDHPKETPMSVPEAAPFANLVQDALNAAVTPERIREKVDQHVNRAVDEAISEAMRSWSETGKVMREAIADSLRVHRLDLPSYGRTVAAIVERQIQARVAEVVAAKLAKDLDDLLHLAPKHVRLSELVAELLGPVEADGCHCEGLPRVYCHLEWSEYRGCTVYLSKETPARPRDADVEIYISLPKKVDEYKRDEAIEGTILLGRVKGTDLKRDVRFGYGDAGQG
ncbi:MAG TPA: hypothetical protein VHF22_03895, partial [Planctomycetota bacterium]|nr:hypothetical protein [Planctomycetota bacterium]